MDSKMNAIKIDVEKKTVSLIELDNSQQAICEAIANGCKSVSVHDHFSSLYEQGYRIFIDETIFERPNNIKGGFNFHLDNGYNSFCNNAIIVNIVYSGGFGFSEIAPEIEFRDDKIDQLKRAVRFGELNIDLTCRMKKPVFA
jgi:hypothetical protein